MLRKIFVLNKKLVRLASIYTAESLLNDHSRRNCVRKFQSMVPLNIGFKEKRTAAVLIPLCIHQDAVCLLYTLRSADLTTHRGQVSFPGGMHDSHDQDLATTALRETHEELGIWPHEVEIWGSGNPIVTRQNIAITPIVGCLKKELNLSQLRLSPREVEEVFAVPISILCDQKYHGHTQFRSIYSTPVYFGGAHRIWGLTAVITHLFLKSLLPASAYKHSVTYLPSVLIR